MARTSRRNGEKLVETAPYEIRSLRTGQHTLRNERHKSADSAAAEAPGRGWGGRIRTFDLLIQSRMTDFRDSSPVVSTKFTDFCPECYRVW